MRDTASSLAGRCAIVTGAARGQGAAEARRLVEAGARVLLTDIRDEQGAALAAELGPLARYQHLDVAVEADWANAVPVAEGQFGPVRMLINNAGTLERAGLEQVTRASFEHTMAVNVTGCLLGLQAVRASMAAAGGGSIVNIASVGALRGQKGAIAYVTSKWAVRGMTKAAANELSRYGIRVNSVNPGAIHTEMIAGPDFDEADFVAANRRRLLIRRMGTVDEVAAAVLWLLSDESSYLTGSEITIDGGWTVD
jgi:3alpha(or 20beta)-hydroxysteroid dehydrogenase